MGAKGHEMVEGEQGFRAVSVAACDTVVDMALHATRCRLSTIGRT